MSIQFQQFSPQFKEPLGNEISQRGFDIMVSSLLILLLSPLIIINATWAICLGSPVFICMSETDALGRSVYKRQFSHGVFRKLAQLFDIIQGRYRLCGASTSARVSLQAQRTLLKYANLPSGLFSLIDVNERVGLSDLNNDELLLRQSQQSFFQYFALCLRGAFCLWMYNRNDNRIETRFSIFDIKINNDTMKEAIPRVVNERNYRIPTTPPKSVFFVNANSINLAQRNAQFKTTLSQADYRFADGSGVRLAAQMRGFQLRDNVNGTDMLPILCEAAIEQGKRIFFFGAAPGVAELAVKKLKQQYPDLLVAGYDHGYHQDSSAVIARINTSMTDILLVALGSPRQEVWVNTYKNQLDCESVLAIGGLFDFYSGTIARAPRWMREVGFEWAYRLYKEPIKKFKRYVVGTPEFLIRTFLLKQA